MDCTIPEIGAWLRAYRERRDVLSGALPPDDYEADDHMPNNGQRADWAEIALRAFQAETRTDDEDMLADLLGDLIHWADRNETDFASQLHRALGMYHEETAEHPDGCECQGCES